MKVSFTPIAIASAIALSACQKDVPRSQLPHLGTFCVDSGKWNDLLAIMKRFAIANGLEFHGGIDQGTDRKPLFNAYVARGYSYWFGDDLDLWFVSDPFRARGMDLNGIAKQPWTSRDTNTARALIKAIAPVRCGAIPNDR